MKAQILGASAWLVLAVCACDGDGASTFRADAAPEVGRDAPLYTAAADAAPVAVDLPLDLVAEAPPPEDAPAADTRPAPTGSPLPAGVGPPRRLFDARSILTGAGRTSCSHQVPPSGNGDRWCAFATTTGAAELWVINATRAAAGEVPPCDGTSPGCLRLTDNLWTGGSVVGPVHPSAHEFHGDTLVFYADALSGRRETHRGPVYVWRPGWARPRRISSDRALLCRAHARALVAHCLEELGGDPMNPDSFEVRAGPIADADGIVLPSLGRIRALGADGLPTWQAAFSPRGDVFALSSPDPDPAVDTLRVVATGELGHATLRPIVRDASAWEISEDGERVFFLRDEGAEGRGLFVADFPSGANVARVASRVTEYALLAGAGPDQAVAFVAALEETRRDFRLLGHKDPPGAASTVFTFRPPLEDVRVSNDQRFTAWADEDFRVRVVRNADRRSCELNVSARLPAYRPSFLDGGGLVFWAEDPGGDRDRRDGYFADPDGCQGKRRFAQAVYFIAPVGDRGIIFADEIDDASQRATLKYAPIEGGRQWPAAGAVRVHEDIDGTSVLPAGLDPLLVVFKVTGGGPDREGTYVFGPVPF